MREFCELVSVIAGLGRRAFAFLVLIALVSVLPQRSFAQGMLPVQWTIGELTQPTSLAFSPDGSRRLTLPLRRPPRFPLRMGQCRCPRL
jgi:hypothetical protein